MHEDAAEIARVMILQYGRRAAQQCRAIVRGHIASADVESLALWSAVSRHVMRLDGEQSLAGEKLRCAGGAEGRR